MTDKVQKIREEVEKRYEYWKEKEHNSHSIESEIRMSECQHLLLMLDSLQEKHPVDTQIKKQNQIIAMHNEALNSMEHNRCSTKHKFKVGDIVRRIGIKEQITIHSIEEDGYVVFLRTGWAKIFFKEQNQWELVEEPVSEDLEEAAKHHLYSNVLYDDVYVGNPTDKDCIEMFKAGANWQREQIAKENMLLPFKEYDNLIESINKRKKEGYEAGYKQGLVDSKSEQKPTLDIEIPFGAKDSELIEETISIPEGCYIIIKDNKIIIRKEKFV